MKTDRHLHLRLQIGGLIADDVGGHRHLVVAFHVHEMKAVAVLIHVLMLAILDESADRKSTRLNSSHPSISYAVFCLKKKKILMPGQFTGVWSLSVRWESKKAFSETCYRTPSTSTCSLRRCK